ncbi:MAG: diaminopimelate decarboxylase [Myxococcales bacterium]|nr:diaminopimelate decarboxylase [Myxococcales bacterium]
MRGEEFAVEGVPLSAIAESVGTPAYVYSVGHIAARYQALTQAFAGQRHRICYAVKANSNLAVLSLLAELGAGADIVSGGELERALAAGFAPETIVYSGVGKSEAEIDAALAAGIKALHVESREELDRVSRRAAARGVRAPIALRINPDIDPETHPYLATGLRETKFGISMGDALALARAALDDRNLRLVGLACHIGSQIMDAEPFLASIERMRPLVAALAGDLEYLDIGGGLGIAYAPGDPVVDTASFGDQVCAATRDLNLEILLEPGRFLVGNGGLLLTRVIGRKRGEQSSFVIVDAAMNDLVRPALYEAFHTIVPARPRTTAERRVVDVVGPVCECGDFFARGRELAWPEVGELLAVLSCGAYAASMASHYNSRPFAPEVLVSRGRFEVVRPRGTVAAMLSSERLPSWREEAAE